MAWVSAGRARNKQKGHSKHCLSSTRFAAIVRNTTTLVLATALPEYKGVPGIWNAKNANTF